MRYLLAGVLVLSIVVGDRSVNGQDDYCFGKDEERTQTRHFSSLTAYEIIKGTNMDKQYLVPNCEARKMWIFHRHGTRLPTKKVIAQASRLDQLRNDIVKNYEARHSKRTASALCDVDYINLKLWKWNSSITADQAEYLTSQGYADMRGTAKLYQRLFPNILGRDYDSNHYLFRHTDTQRTTESFKAFAEGLFGANSNARAEPVSEKDYLLRPYDYCDSWKEHNYNEANSEDYRLRHSALWNQTIKAISARLGFEYALESSDIDLMFAICRFEQAWKVDRTSPWCAAFLPEHIYLLEYELDLKYYYKCGYGYDENLRLNCRLVQDMLKQLSSASSSSSSPSANAIVNFGHSTGLQTLLTALGIAKDDVSPMASNYHNMSQRRWTTSSLDPFASNLVVVKYECNDLTESRENVIFYLNQNALFLDWCKVGLCNWFDVLKRYEHFKNADCGAYYCRSGSPAPATIAASSIVALLIAAAINYLTY